MQETKLAKHLCRSLALSGENARRVREWRTGNSGGCVQGDLSEAVAVALKRTLPRQQQARDMSIKKLNEHLTDLASHCRFTVDECGKPVNASGRSVNDIIDSLFWGSSHVEAKWLVRVLLKDMFYPFPEPHARWIMDLFHSLMWKIYQVRTSLELTCETVQAMVNRGIVKKGLNPVDWEEFRNIGPVLGTAVSIMECEQAKSATHFLNASLNKQFTGSFFAEKKEDGERMQVHVDLTRPLSQQITIFSKSGRNSTQDRLPVHATIRQSLIRARLPIQKNAIIEGELLLWNSRLNKVDEFSAVRTYQRNGFKDKNVHYCVCWFDVLLIDDRNVMNKTLKERRELLKDCVGEVYGYSWIVETREFPLTVQGTDQLAEYFVETVSQGCEGLVLKPCSSRYRPGKYVGHGWFKLKRDYIEGFARFEKEMAVVGGSYGERTGAKMDPRTKEPLLAVFWLAAMHNKDEYRRMPNKVRPNMFLLQSVAFGLSIKDLVQLNAELEFNSVPIETVSAKALKYDLTNVIGGRIDFLFKTPFVVEILGSDEGFHREVGHSFYTIRFPRIRKVRTDVRWTDPDCLGFYELQSLARKNTGPVVDDGERERLRRLLRALEAQHRRDGTVLPRPESSRRVSEMFAAQLQPSEVVSSSTGTSQESKGTKSTDRSRDRDHSSSQDQEDDDTMQVGPTPFAVPVFVAPAPPPPKRQRTKSPIEGPVIVLSSESGTVPPSRNVSPHRMPPPLAPESVPIGPVAPAQVGKEPENRAPNQPPEPHSDSGSQEHRVLLPLLSPNSKGSETRNNSPKKQSVAGGVAGAESNKSSDHKTPTSTRYLQTGAAAQGNTALFSPSFYKHREENSIAERPISTLPEVPETKIRPGPLFDFRTAFFFAPSTVRWLNPLRNKDGVPAGLPAETPDHVKELLASNGATRFLGSAVSTLDSLLVSCGWTTADGAVDDRIGVILVDREKDEDFLVRIKRALSEVISKLPPVAGAPYPTPIAIWDWHVLDHIEVLSEDSHTDDERFEEMLELRDQFLVDEYTPDADYCWSHSQRS